MQEKIRERKRIGEKRRAKRRKRFVIGILLCAVLISAAAIGTVVGSNALKSNSNASSGNKSGEAKALQIDNGKENSDADTDSVTDRASGESNAPDRHDFEAKPGDIPENFEQSEEKIAYLTIDDGPSNLTEPVLDILDEYGIKATFFVTGAMPEYSYMIKEAYDRGHTIGLHTYSHDYASIYSSVDAYFTDLDAIGQVVKNEIGYVPCFIRFPGGSSNTVSAKYTSGIMTTLVSEVNARGYQYYDWNASTGDGAVRTWAELVGLGTSYNENNLIILAHDSASKQTTVDALPAIIEHYQYLGYEFKAIDRDSYVPHHGVNN